jgi:hypothetical protein
VRGSVLPDQPRVALIIPTYVRARSSDITVFMDNDEVIEEGISSTPRRSLWEKNMQAGR